MRIVLFSYAALVLAVLIGCSSRSIGYDFDQRADFTAYATYAWHERDGEHTIAEEAPLAHQRIVAAIDREMTAKGFEEVSSDPDVLIAYHASDREETVISTTRTGYGYSPYWYWGGFGMRTSTDRTTTHNYTVGTLVIDMWDAEADQMVWRGIASDTVSDDPSRNARLIDSIVTDVFKRYPPRQR